MMARAAYDQDRAHTEILDIEPDAREVEQAGMRCLRYGRSTPAHSFEYTAVLHRDGVALMKARDSYDELLASKVVDSIAACRLDASRVTVLRDFECPGYAFDQVAVVPPPWSESFADSTYLQSVSYWAFPSHACEIEDGFDGEDFSYLIGKGSRISVIDWNRTIVPQVLVRLTTAWPGGMLGTSRKPGMVRWQHVLHILANMPEGQIVEVSNSQRDMCIVGRRPDGWQIDVVLDDSSIRGTLAEDESELEMGLSAFCSAPD